MVVISEHPGGRIYARNEQVCRCYRICVHAPGPCTPRSASHGCSQELEHPQCQYLPICHLAQIHIQVSSRKYDTAWRSFKGARRAARSRAKNGDASVVTGDISLSETSHLGQSSSMGYIVDGPELAYTGRQTGKQLLWLQKFDYCTENRGQQSNLVIHVRFGGATHNAYCKKTSTR
jgi:hypothetical protein